MARPKRSARSHPFPISDIAGAYASQKALADALRMNASLVRQLVDGDGGLSPIQADRAAVRTGRHPSEVWPDWFAPTELELDRAR